MLYTSIYLFNGTNSDTRECSEAEDKTDEKSLNRITVSGGLTQHYFLLKKRPTDSQKLAMLKGIGEKSEVYPQEKVRRYLPF